MPSKSKFKMPADRQIWAEVDARIATIPEAFKRIKGEPDRDALFAEKKAWYLDTPNRLLREAEFLEQRKLEDIAKKEADLAYLKSRKDRGLPTYTQAELISKYPEYSEFTESYASVQMLHQLADLLEFLRIGNKITKKYKRLDAITRNLHLTYTAQAYDLYWQIMKSDIAARTFEEIRNILKYKHMVKTHDDKSSAAYLLQFVFAGMSTKTATVTGRALQLAYGYEVEPANFITFYKEMGGQEKIAKAYALVLAAEAGKRPAYVKNAEHFASRQAIWKMPIAKSIKLTEYEERSFYNNPQFDACLILARVDSSNGTLDLLANVPISKSIEAEMLDLVSASERRRGSTEWASDAKSQINKSLNKTLKQVKSRDAKLI